MKYKIKTEKVTPGEHEIEVPLPLGYEDVELTDKIVRKEARNDFNGKVSLEPGEHVKEVWREGVRIYPRIVSDGRKKPGPKPSTTHSFPAPEAEDA